MTDLTTPLPYRSVSDTEFRNRYEAEMWADLAAVVFRSGGAAGTLGAGVTLTGRAPLVVPCPVACRLQILSTVHLYGTTDAGQLIGDILEVDGAATTDSAFWQIGTTTDYHTTLTVAAIADVAPGSHTLSFRLNNTGAHAANYDRGDIIVRRGRRPSGS